MLFRLRDLVEQHARRITLNHQNGVLLFVSLSDGKKRAQAHHFFGVDFAQVWEQVVRHYDLWMKDHGTAPCWVRIDWARTVRQASLGQVERWFKEVKRNYMRWGMVIGGQCQYAFTEQELNANAMLYQGTRVPNAQINKRNFRVYGQRKYADFEFDFAPEQSVHLVDTAGVFISTEEGPYLLYRRGRNAGRRVIRQLAEPRVTHLISTASQYLTQQVQSNGRFYYGWHPCFDREIRFYNTLRHASTVYSMVEAWEVTRCDALKAAIDRALQYAIETFVKYDQNAAGEQIAFLVEHNLKEIKLGANAVLILALTKYSEVFDTEQYLPLLTALALGIQLMQDPQSGQLTHVLNYPDLSTKEKFRVIYYDGEAAFGLMRLYGLTRDDRWLAIVEKAFEYFIAAEHWKIHDHWLSYCVNELTRYKEEEKYYRFGIQNVAGYLDFVANRITTFPTLLELMMAAEQMVERLRQSDQFRHLLDELDQKAFYQALEKRAHYLLNGYFAPEIAMYFANPQRILGSFFIRHHSFRVRIDDVEHYLSGYVAYLKYLKKKRANKNLMPKLLKTVGMLSYSKNPKNFFEANTIANQAQKKGLSLFYFSYESFNLLEQKQRGYLFQNGSWIEWFDNLPAVIDNAPPRNKRELEVDRILRSQSRLTFNFLGGKRKTFEILNQKKSVEYYLIDYFPASLKKLKELLENWQTLVLKPFSSNRGRNVFILKYVDNETCILKSDKKELQLKIEKAWKVVGANENWLIQKYVHSVSADGKPFDIRAPVFRGEKGEWQLADMYARVGQSRVTSNLATGGESLDGVKFLQTLFGISAYREVHEKIKTITKQIVALIQTHYEFEIDALGCDFGLDGRRPYLFEVNAYPGLKGCYKTAIPIKVDYYKHLLNKK